MKQLKITLSLLFLTLISLNAQNSKIAGDWILKNIEENGKLQDIYQICEFKKDGSFLVMGYQFANWKYDKKNNAITLNSKIEKDFNGSLKIIKLNDKILELEKGNQKYFYLRYDKEKALQENKNSKLEGVWKFKNKYNDIIYLKFSLPSDVTIYSIEDQGNITSTSKGSWLYNSKEKSILTVILSNDFNGKHFLTKQSDTIIEFKYKNENILANKIEQETNKLEKLNFSEDDFPEETNQKLPLVWSNLYDGIISLNNIKSLVYDNCEFIDEIGVFNCDEYKIDVNANENNEKINFSIKYNKYESIKKVSKGGYDDNAFFPENYFFTYKIVSKEKITVPAGTFDCTVVEAIEDFDDKVKLWMINDKAGVYAKKIKTRVDVFGKNKYEMHILKKIIKK